jgi:hypothetical protein
MAEKSAPTHSPQVKLARCIFLLAAAYGFFVLTSWMFITPRMVGHARHQQPEIYYGFGSVGLAWQVVFVLIAADPVRYRPLMLLAAVFEKFFFSGILIVLMLRHIAGLHWIPAAAVDGVLGIGFVVAYLLTPP